MIDDKLLGYIGELKLAVERMDYELKEFIQEIKD